MTETDTKGNVTQERDARRVTITVYACPTCGYWREEEKTGVHVIYPGRGPGIRHDLIPTTYVFAGLD